MAPEKEEGNCESATDKEGDRRDSDSVDEAFVEAPSRAGNEDIKPSDSISQNGDITNDDATSIAPTLVGPATKPLRSARTPSSGSDKFTSTGDICFSFGRDSFYFLYLVGGNILARHVVDSPSLRAIKAKEYEHVYMHSFSPHDDEFCVYKNKHNAVSWSFHQGNKSSITYRSLRDWLVKNIDVTSHEKILKSRVVFGEGASFFASNGTTCIHHDLPTRLSDEIDRRLAGTDSVLPDILSLGANETYFARWPRTVSSGKATALWALTPDCKLHQSVTSASFNCAEHAYVFLNPTNSKHFVSVFKSGMMEYQLIDAAGLVKDHFKAYMQLKANETKTTFNLMFTTGTGLKTEEVTYIGTETNYDMPQLDGEEDEKKAEKVKDSVKSSGVKKKRFSLFGRKGEN